jgi:hypothetical protein
MAGSKSKTGSTDPLIQKLSAQSQIIDFTNVKQCFLLSQAEILGKLSIEGENKNGFLHSLALVDADIGTLVSKINKPADVLNKALNITPLEYSRFVPKIELYKVLYSGPRTFIGEAPIPFSTDSGQSLQSILNSSSGRGDDAGIVEFSINFENQNPYAATRMVNGSLKILFQNGESLTKDRVLRISSEGGGTTSFRFSDLISRRGQSAREFFGEHYRIRADIGYQAPSNYSHDISDALIEQLQSMNLSLILELIDYELNFEQNGALTLEISYRSFIEAQLERSFYDIFTITSNQNYIKTEGLEDSLKSISQQLKKVESDIETQESIMAAAEAEIEKSTIALDKRAENFANLSELEDLQDKRESLQSQVSTKSFQINKAEGVNKVQKYSRILEYLYQNNKVRRLRVPKDQLLYYSDEYVNAVKQDVVNQDLFGSLPSFSEGAAEQQLANEIVKSNRQNAELKELVKEQTGGTVVEGRTDIGAEFARRTNVAIRNNEGNLLSSEELTKIQGEVFTDINFQITQDDEPNTDSETMDVYWLYYGDILTAVIEMAQLGEKISKDKIGFMFGSAMIPGVEKNLAAITLLDMPISLDMFLQFFKKMFIDKNVTRYSLNKFMHESINQLLLPSMNQMCFAESTKRPVTVKTTTLEVGSQSAEGGNQIINPFPSNVVEQNKRIIIASPKGKELVRLTSGDVIRRRNANQRLYYTLTYIAENGLPTSLNGDPIADSEKGVYHFYIGADRGLAKEVSFSKAKKNFQAEAMAQKAVADDDEFAEIFNLFNVDINMIGNTLLKPGAYIYVNPTLTGLGQQTSRVLGLGGYYLVLGVSNTINKDGWTTSVQADSVSRVSNPNQNVYTPDTAAASTQQAKLEDK